MADEIKFRVSQVIEIARADSNAHQTCACKSESFRDFAGD
jgi:hypothetical protein